MGRVIRVVFAALIALSLSCSGEEASQPDAVGQDAVADEGEETLDTVDREVQPSCATAEDCNETACNDFDQNCFGD